MDAHDDASAADLTVEASGFMTLNVKAWQYGKRSGTPVS